MPGKIEDSKYESATEKLVSRGAVESAYRPLALFYYTYGLRKSEKSAAATQQTQIFKKIRLGKFTY